jgi:hypothetical protein
MEEKSEKGRDLTTEEQEKAELTERIEVDIAAKLKARKKARAMLWRLILSGWHKILSWLP